MEKPNLRIQNSAIDVFIEILCALAIMSIGYVVLIKMDSLPNQLPIHYDFSGKPDKYSSKSAFWILPMIAVFLYILLTIVTKFPHLFNYPYEITKGNAERQYKNSILMVRLIKTIIVFQFLYIITIRTVAGSTLSIYFIPVALLLLLSTIIFFLVRGFLLR